MNPYLRLKTRVPDSTFFYAWEFLESSWPETEPQSSTRPKASFKVVDEKICSGSDSGYAIVTVAIYAGDDFLGTIPFTKRLRLSNNVFTYSDPAPDYPPALPAIIRWDDLLGEKLEDFYNSWEPTGQEECADIWKSAAFDLLINEASRLIMGRTPASDPASEQIFVSYAVWPFGDEGPTIVYAIWGEPLTGAVGQTRWVDTVVTDALEAAAYVQHWVTHLDPPKDTSIPQPITDKSEDYIKRKVEVLQKEAIRLLEAYEARAVSN